MTLISPALPLDASRPARQLTGLQYLVNGIGSNLELSAADHSLLRELSLSQARCVESNLLSIATKWQTSLPGTQYLDVDWKAWSRFFHDAALRDYADDAELSDLLVSISQTLSQIARLIAHPDTQSLIGLYRKYLSRMRISGDEQMQELEEWITHQLPQKSQLRERRLHERQTALRQQLFASGFLAFARDGAGQQLPPDEALEELMCDGVPVEQLVADYIFRNHCQISREQIRSFFLYVICSERIEHELHPAPILPPSTGAVTNGSDASASRPEASDRSTAAPSAPSEEAADPYHILHPDADPQLVQECVHQAEALIGDNQFKYAHLMKVMLDHQVLCIQQTDHDPFARTLESWGCAGGKRSDLVKASIRQRLRKIMDARKTPAGHTLSLYRTWPETDPDRQICLQLAAIFTQAGFEYPRSC